MKCRIIKIKGDWREVLNDCRFTVNKKDIDKEPSKEFKKRILIAEHSPIRDIIYKWEWLQLPHWVTVHWVRHKWEKFVNTQRTDKTGVSRNELPQDSPQDFRGEANVQHLIDTFRKRLCFCASSETRASAVALKHEIEKTDEDIAWVLVPNCIYRCGCPEDKGCNFFNRFVENFPENRNILDINDRYDVYKEMYNYKGEK